MTSAAHILVVDDDVLAQKLIEAVLKPECYRLSFAANADEAERALIEGDVDLVLLDIGLPGEDGISIARRLRATSDIGIIMVSSRDHPVDRVVGLEVGADDYITKPFDRHELHARIRSLLRRLRLRSVEPLATNHREVWFRDWRLNLDAGALANKEGNEVHLTAAEFRLLQVFVTHAGRVLSRDFLSERVATREWTPFDRSIDVLVSKLRKKIEPDARRPSLIVAVRGLGYKFAGKVRYADSS